MRKSAIEKALERRRAERHKTVATLILDTGICLIAAALALYVHLALGGGVKVLVLESVIAVLFIGGGLFASRTLDVETCGFCRAMVPRYACEDSVCDVCSRRRANYPFGSRGTPVKRQCVVCNRRMHKMQLAAYGDDRALCSQCYEVARHMIAERYQDEFARLVDNSQVALGSGNTWHAIARGYYDPVDNRLVAQETKCGQVCGREQSVFVNSVNWINCPPCGGATTDRSASNA